MRPPSLNPFKESGLFHRNNSHEKALWQKTSQSLQGIRSFSCAPAKDEFNAMFPGLNPFKESGLFHSDGSREIAAIAMLVSIPSRNQVFFIKCITHKNGRMGKSVSIPSRNQVFFIIKVFCGSHIPEDKSQSLQGIRSFSLVNRRLHMQG